MAKPVLVGIISLMATIMVCCSGVASAVDLNWIRSMGLYKDRYFLLTPEANEALQDLNSIFDKDVLMWVASMYDPESGGFYYARSAVGRDGFAADIESTSQALSFLKSMGIFNSMPEHIRQGFITFFQSRQDPETGYFYDPQFGSKVSNSKRSRNLSQAVGRLRDLNAEPLYPLPYSKEREVAQAGFPSLLGPLFLSGQSGIGVGGAADTSAAQSVKIPTLPEYLTSAEALRRWLESFDWENRPWNAGHNASSARTEITQVGLLDVVYEFIEEIQNPDTGLWGKGRTLEEVSGAMKLSGYYSSGRAYPRAKKMVESTIYAIKNHRPTAIVHIRNPVDLITTAVIRGSVGYDPEIEAMLRDNMPLMIRWAKECLLRFKQPDKAFSYSESGSSRTSQGAVVSLGLAEADMNGTMAGAHATINYLYQMLGLSRPNMAEYAEEFWDVVVNMEPHERIEVPTGLEDDFEDAIVSWIPKGLATAKIVTDPHDPANKVLEVQKTAVGSGSSVSKNFETRTGAEQTRISLKFMVSELGNGGAFNLRFGSGSSASQRAFALMIAKRDGVSFISHRATEKGYGDRISTIDPNVWYELDIEYRPAGKDDTELAVYMDGELMQVFNDYYHGGDASRLPIQDIKYVEFYAYVDAVATLWVDDIKVSVD
ncbi:MAG: hypothetical protein ACOYEP_02455 [Limnochordia bacterium]|jgi:hypothetical protein